MTTTRKILASLLAGSLTAPVVAAEKADEILKVKKSTFVNLVDLLVQRGVLKQDEGKGLVKAAEEEADEMDKAQAAEGAVAHSGSASAETVAKVAVAADKSGKSMHVSYVPEIVKKEIREQVRAELRADVAKDVQAKAKEEKWGIPAALPDWVSRIHPYFDMRLRLADEFYSDQNVVAFDWLQINEENGLVQATALNKAFLNTRSDRLRLRERFRIGFDADITEGLKAGFRFATSNQFSPVSNNQTLGNTGRAYQFAIDRAFLQYDFADAKGRDWFSVYGGRFANPFVSTDVVFDQDLSMEGLAGTFRWRFNRDDPTVKGYQAPSPTARFGINQGTQTPDSVFATLGVFPIEEVNFSTSDKWMFGGQLGADWLVSGDARLTVAASYYDFKNVRARRNSLNSRKYDWTAPEFMQKGNSLVAINDGGNQSDCANNVCRVGLASDFRVFNATATYDYAGFAPTHVLFTADYAKNLGFDEERIAREFGTRINPRTNAFQARVDIGHPEVRRFNDWSVYLAYRYVERDAVLDAFTDSLFHQGGTNAKGWMAGIQYGLAKNTWLNLRWLSTGSISHSDEMLAGTGKRYDIDTVNLDLNARF
ncbi:MAG: hypothetical protein FIA96_02825 [Betaproteobacteria bacterium]|nr:hypothetical protein [Betaproteobacteria bacterium]